MDRHHRPCDTRACGQEATTTCNACWVPSHCRDCSKDPLIRNEHVTQCAMYKAFVNFLLCYMDRFEETGDPSDLLMANVASDMVLEKLVDNNEATDNGLVHVSKAGQLAHAVKTAVSDVSKTMLPEAADDHSAPFNANDLQAGRGRLKPHKASSRSSLPLTVALTDARRKLKSEKDRVVPPATRDPKQPPAPGSIGAIMHDAMSRRRKDVAPDDTSGGW
jgi:hypothetical protein